MLPFGLFRDEDLQKVVTDGVFQLNRCFFVDHAFDDMLYLSKRQTELNQGFVGCLGGFSAISRGFDVLGVAQLDLVGVRVEEVLPDHAPGHDSARMRRRL